MSADGDGAGTPDGLPEGAPEGVPSGPPPEGSGAGPDGPPAEIPSGPPPPGPGAGPDGDGADPFVVRLPSRGARPTWGSGRWGGAAGNGAGDGAAGPSGGNGNASGAAGGDGRAGAGARGDGTGQIGGANGGPGGPGSTVALLAGAGGNGRAGGGALVGGFAAAPSVLTPSRLMEYLPSLYQGDDFLGRFLRIFEDIIAPIERTIDNVGDSLDPELAPEEFLPWLASWMGVDLDENWPPAMQRELIASAATLYRWRGTRRGLREHLRIYTGFSPLIVENFTGLRLGQDAVLGVNARLGTYHPHCFYVTAVAARPASLDERILRRIVEAEKPANTGYLLEVQPAPAASGSDEPAVLGEG